MASITVHWTDNRRVSVYIKFHQGWNWDALYTAHDQVNAMLRQQPNTVDLIYDMHDTLTLPNGYFDHLKRIHDAYPPNCGMVLMVGCNNFITQMLRGLTRNYWEMAHRYAFCDTLDEAVEMVGP